jgi:hypothetical protein
VPTPSTTTPFRSFAVPDVRELKLKEPEVPEVPNPKRFPPWPAIAKQNPYPPRKQYPPVPILFRVIDEEFAMGSL